MNSSINKWIIVFVLGLILTACSSPEEQKIEKETGFKISKIKDAYQIKKEMKDMEDNFGFFDALMDPAKAQKLKKKHDKLQEKAKEYKPIYEALDDFLDADPTTYGKVLGKDKEWERTMYVSLKKDLEEFIKSDTKIKEMLRDIKDFLNNLSEDKASEISSGSEASKEYKKSARKEYGSKLENLEERYSEVVKIFKEQHKDMKYILDKMRKPDIYLFFDIPRKLKFFNESYLDVYGE